MASSGLSAPGEILNPPIDHSYSVGGADIQQDETTKSIGDPNRDTITMQTFKSVYNETSMFTPKPQNNQPKLSENPIQISVSNQSKPSNI